MDADAHASDTEGTELRAEAIALAPEAVIERIDEILELAYRSKSLGNVDDPLDEAIYILLTVQTREQAYRPLFDELRTRYKTWSNLALAPRDELEDFLRPLGFQRRRAETLQSFLSCVAEANKHRGTSDDYSLDYLRKLPDEEVLAELCSLPGLGPKTARCIMSNALSRDVFAVDTHVRRTFDRLGLVRDTGGKIDHEPYESLVPAKTRDRLHVNLIHHGRAVCGSRPKCDACPLISFCPTGQQTLKADSRPVAVEVFAGAGGLALGFKQAGFRVAVAVEMERNAAQTHRINHPGTVVLERNVAEVEGRHIRAVAPWAGEITAVIGGPPCQGYSVAGKRDPNDKKNQLFTHQVRLSAELDTRFVVIENVLGMRNIKGVSFPEAVLAELEKVGYHARHDKVLASDYGVPQMRWRLIFTAQKNGHGDAPQVPVGDFCGSLEVPCRCGREKTDSVLDVLARPGLPQLDSDQEAEYVRLGGGLVLLNGSTMKHSEKVIAKIAGIQAGKGPISYRRLHKDLARTIVAGHRALPVHPTLHRTISVREAARIQGFPDDYVFCGSRGKQPLQVANAVPPVLGQAVADELIRVIQNKSKPTSQPPSSLCGPPVLQLVFLPEQVQGRATANKRSAVSRAAKAAGY